MLLRLSLLLLLTASPAMASSQILQQALAQFQSITSYSTTMRSYGNSEHVIEYRYQKPGYVRMDFIKPHKGAVLVYRPDTGKVKLRPFGFSKWLTLTMKPTASMVRSPAGHQVDESDLGTLLRNARELEKHGATKILREEILQKSTSVVVEILGNEDVLVDKVHRYLLWMDKESKLPRVVESYDKEDQLIEGLRLDDLKLNPVFGQIFNL